MNDGRLADTPACGFLEIPDFSLPSFSFSSLLISLQTYAFFSHELSNHPILSP